MKIKCPVCKTEKARRECVLKSGEQICSRCCAESRGPDCGECPHYAETLRHAVQRNSTLPEGHFIAEINPEVEEEVDAALELATRKKIDQAFDVMNRLATENPRNHAVCFGMGTLYAISGRHAESIPWFQKAISIFPYMAEAHYNLGMAYKHTYNLGQMIKSLRKAVQYGGSQEECYQSAQELLDDAKRIISKSNGVDLDSYVNASDKFDAAYTYLENQQWAAALSGFKAAAVFNGNNAPTYGNMGLCLAQLGRKAEALAALDQALEIDPTYEPAIGNRFLFEQMEEGVPQKTAQVKTINYSAELLEKAKRRNRWFNRD